MEIFFAGMAISSVGLHMPEMPGMLLAPPHTHPSHCHHAMLGRLHASGGLGGPRGGLARVETGTQIKMHGKDLIIVEPRSAPERGERHRRTGGLHALARGRPFLAARPLGRPPARTCGLRFIPTRTASARSGHREKRDSRGERAASARGLFPFPPSSPLSSAFSHATLSATHLRSHQRSCKPAAALRPPGRTKH
eukprot:366452-Chlamydomonas_euryale.AAC.6